MRGLILLLLAVVLLAALPASAGRNRNVGCPDTCDPFAEQPARIMADRGFVCVCGTGDFDQIELQVRDKVHLLVGEVKRGQCRKFAVADCSEDYVPARMRGRSTEAAYSATPWSDWSEPFEVFLQACPEAE